MASTGRLMGTGEIADRLGVSRQRAYVISRQRGFPEPFDELEMGAVWLREDVERWVAKNRPARAEDPEG